MDEPDRSLKATRVGGLKQIEFDWLWVDPALGG